MTSIKKIDDGVIEITNKITTSKGFNIAHFDFSNIVVEFDDFFIFEYVGTYVFNISQQDVSIPLKQNYFFDYIKKNDVGDYVILTNISLPKNYNFDNFDKSLPFLFKTEGSGRSKKITEISYCGDIIPILDPLQECKYKYLSIEDAHNIGNENTKKNAIDIFSNDNIALVKASMNYQNTILSVSNISNYFKLPLDTYDVLKNIKPDNFSLRLNKKTAYKNIGDNKFGFKLKTKQEEGGQGEYFKGNNYFGNYPFDKNQGKQQKLANDILNNNISEFTMRPSGRMVIGLGLDSVYETSMTLHHIYGFPYIPASSIKGVLRSYIIANVKLFDNKETLAITCKDFCDIFGCPAELKDKDKKNIKSYYQKARQGDVIFFDAMPIKKPNIKTDVMTPHYGDYYKNKDSKKKIYPTDNQKINIIPFLTVEDTPFYFVFGSKKLADINTSDYWGKTISTWLAEALTDHGIGAKTAVGYGYFQAP